MKFIDDVFQPSSDQHGDEDKSYLLQHARHRTERQKTGNSDWDASSAILDYSSEHFLRKSWNYLGKTEGFVVDKIAKNLYSDSLMRLAWKMLIYKLVMCTATNHPNHHC